ncbi:unnamed protein product [Meloidogyne enterolobii]|uniref:Uncharacterized protein n=1 Tax=Meloidogyne enterolobii TaxID=390850 RepID=A0ACB0ZTK5_MELEN
MHFQDYLTIHLIRVLSLFFLYVCNDPLYSFRQPDNVLPILSLFHMNADVL